MKLPSNNNEVKLSGPIEIENRNKITMKHFEAENTELKQSPSIKHFIFSHKKNLQMNDLEDDDDDNFEDDDDNNNFEEDDD